MKTLGLVVILASSTAGAAPGEGYLELGGMLGVTAPVAGPHAMISVGAGVHVANTLWLRGLASYGPASDVDEGGGTNRQLRAGVESQLCSPDGYACFTPAVDVGVQRGHWQDSELPPNVEDTNVVVVVPRVGGDFGTTIRFRVGFEIDLLAAGASNGRSGLYGFDLTTGVAMRW